MTTSATQPADQVLATLLADPLTEEVMINGPSKIWTITAGRKIRHALAFEDDDELRAAIGRLASAANRALDEHSPLVDVRLPDGSRLNAVIAPLAPATTVTLRRFVLRERTLDDLVKLGVLSADPSAFLQAAVRSGINILICGGTSTGKTTLLNALCSCVEPDERIVTIEETRELALDHTHEDVCALECHTVAGGKITIRDLVKNALRMRPNRIIVGEVRGPEALDMLTAMSSGHEGSMCTVHADSPREALAKLHTYALMTGEGIPSSAVLDMIGRSVQLVVFCRRARDGDTRYVDTIFEVTGIQSGVITGHELWTRQDGELRWSGVRPQCEARLTDHGHDLARVFRSASPALDRRSYW